MHFLELLQHETFRENLKNTPVADIIYMQQRNHWLYYRNNRYRNAGPQPVPPVDDHMQIDNEESSQEM